MLVKRFLPQSLCSLSLSSEVFPLLYFGPCVHFTVNWIS